MACVAHKIIAAPFACVGSIGVLSMMVNVDKFLKKKDIDPYLVTSGKHKRTIDVIGEVTPEGVEKLSDEMREIHRAFKAHIARFRPQIDIEKVATGEHWLAIDAVSQDLGLVDYLSTSQQYLEMLNQTANVVIISKKKEDKSLVQKLLSLGVSAWHQALQRGALMMRTPSAVI